MIDTYVNMLTKWNRKINLVQVDTLKIVYERHIEDSRQIIDLLDKKATIIDIGTGGGFPGVILSIYGFDKMLLCEKNHKKCVFLEEVKVALGLNFKIYNGDIYKLNVSREAFGEIILVSRAFGALIKLLKIMTKTGADYGVFHKGERYLNEIEEAENDFTFDYTKRESATNKTSIIIKVFNVREKRCQLT